MIENPTNFLQQFQNFIEHLANTLKNKAEKSEISDSINALSTVAKTGSYTDLINIPEVFDGNYNSLSNLPSLNFLPLSGGTMTSSVAMKRNVDSEDLQLFGGTAQANGAGIWLYGKTKANLQGVFCIRATANSENKDLIGYPNGNLTWGGKNVAVFTYGTSDLTAGSSALETGKLHFVYE